MGQREGDALVSHFMSIDVVRVGVLIAGWFLMPLLLARLARPQRHVA